MFSPLYKASRLLVGNPQSNVAVCCLWTKAKNIAAQLNPSDYCVIGNLFSAERGLDILVRNLLANPNITNLVVTGADLSKSGVVLRDFFEKGFEKGKTEVTAKPCWRVKSQQPGYIDMDIPEKALEELRKSVLVSALPDIAKLDGLQKPAAKRQKQVFMKPDETVKQYEGEDVAYIVRNKNVAGVWLQILDTILKFGKVSGTHYDDRQKEIVDLISVITDEDPDNMHIPDFLPCDTKQVKEYIPKVTTDYREQGTSYTYGSRIRSWFGVDQVKEAVAKLVRERVSRAVVINLWDSTKDLTIGGSPCLNHIWFRIRDGKLCMTCTIRSNDMFEAYPDNAFGLRALQEVIRKDLLAELKKKGIVEDIKLGDLIINSQSAHVYEDCWDRAQQIVNKYYSRYVIAPSLQLDPRGNVVIGVSNGKIRAEHISSGGEPLGVYEGKTARELRDKLARENIIGNTAHAIYVGIELARAEQALKDKKGFEQDSA